MRARRESEEKASVQDVDNQDAGEQKRRRFNYIKASSLTREQLPKKGISRAMQVAMKEQQRKEEKEKRDSMYVHLNHKNNVQPESNAVSNYSSVEKPAERGSVNKWLDFSMNQQTEKDIEYALLYKPEYVCVSYLCRYSQMTEQFMERLIALTASPVCKYTTEEEIEKLQDAMIKLLTSDESDRKSIMIELTTCDKGSDYKPYKKDFDVNKLSDRIDWTYVSIYQILSEDFILKYIRQLNLNAVLHNQRLSSKAKEEIKKKLSNQKEVKKPETAFLRKVMITCR